MSAVSSSPSETLAGERQVTAIIIGGGQRGYQYSLYSLDFPGRFGVVGLAEPRSHRKEIFKRMFGLSDDVIVDDWRELARREKLADIACICVQDQMHKEVAITFADLGYHILLEKPMAVTEKDCREIFDACARNNTIMTVCHVLRYAPHNRKIKELISNGSIGTLLNIEHTEPVGFYHFAHSFVRGNWRREDMSSFSMMTKCCHDVDLVKHWTSPLKPEKIVSFGSLSHFKPEHQPAEAKALGVRRCSECPVSVKSVCPYDADKIYLEPLRSGQLGAGRNVGWPTSVIVDTPDIEEAAVVKALSEGPYGRCVYACDNDVCDNQKVIIEYEGGCLVHLNMIGPSEKLCQRSTVVRGSLGEITCLDTHTVTLFDFITRKQTVFNVLDVENMPKTRMTGHGYADYYLMHAFISSVSQQNRDMIGTSALDSLDSHLLVFRIEESRKEGKIITL